MPSGDAETLANRVAEILLDEDLAGALGSAGRQFVIQHLDARDSAQRVMSIYDAVLCQRAASHQAHVLPPALPLAAPAAPVLQR